jgi:very-short-patch-repair endonuclease
MPRYKKYLTNRQRLADTATKSRVYNVYDWSDPFPLGFGTVPEKMVYAALTEMGIEFYYLNDISFSDPTIDFFKEYQADFIIPSIKVIIEVQGAYWHSKPAAIEADSYKFAVYQSFGYKALAWWDYEIQSNLANLLVSEPLFASAPKRFPGRDISTELTPLKRTKTDTSQGIRTMNARKRKPYRTFIGAPKKTVRKGISGYATK